MSIKKFEKDILGGKSLHIQKKYGDLSYPIHRHEYFEIIFYCGTKGKCILNGAEYKIQDNAVFFLTPEDFHLIETENIKSAYSVKLSFSKEIIDPKMGEFSPISAKVLYSPNDFFISAINELLKISELEAPQIKSKKYHLLNALLIEIIENGQTAGGANTYMHPLIGKVMMFALTDPSKKISLEAAAKLCHISPAYFSHIFHAQTGKRFKEWLNEIKIEHACRLLENTQLSVLEISLECGFSSISHFGKIFKSTVGMTPKEYKKYE